MQRTLFLICYVFWLILRCRSTNTSSFRKIKEGKNVEVDMNFMVYLVKAPNSVQTYDAWICGGAIVSSDLIVTSAACVEDVEFMYAIAGYNKYVNGPNLETDQCTKNSRKKVVFSSVPKSYNIGYEDVQKWAFIDIAAVQVESPFDFNAKAPGCSWAPRAIDISYDPKYQEPNTDAMVLGWGHVEKWRLPGDKKDYNQEKLQYGPLLLMSKSECKQYYNNVAGMSVIIDKYMICAMKEGNIDDKGNLRNKVTPDPTLTDGCQPGAHMVKGQCQPEDRIESLPDPTLTDGCEAGAVMVEGQCQPEDRIESLPLFKEFPRIQPNPLGIMRQQLFRPRRPPRPINMQLHNNPFNTKPSLDVNSKNKEEDTITFDDIIFNNFRRTDNLTENGNYTYTRKAGICQNDHGGPLVTWVGKHEVLIGVASVFRVNNSYDCEGPYLFTSTQCNGAFLDCVLRIAAITSVDNDTTTEGLSGQHNREHLLFKRPNFSIPNNDYVEGVNLGKKQQNPETSESDCKEAADPKGDQPLYDERLQYKRRADDLCNLPPEQTGFHLVQRRISWRNHPDGPAQNEL